MTEYKNLLVQMEQGITVVTINRPKSMNALNSSTLEEMKQLFAILAKDEATKIVIITGGGESAFVAGADIVEMQKLNPMESRKFSILGQTVFNTIENLPQIVIAAVNGYALGGGCELAMACDIRIASTKAVFGQPEVSLGIIPGFGGTQRLAQLVGKGRAKEIICTTNMIKAEDAYRIGLVNAMVEPTELMDAAKVMANKIMSKAPVAVQLAKDAINRGFDMNLQAGLAYEADNFGICFGTDDQKEGMKAYLEKRKPVFAGK
ncbi:MAG: crotonase [Acholeplasmataceae bacterium]|nr:crotonase [Acholeplasmataceae bacterium]